jgi:hypothetical protein
MEQRESQLAPSTAPSTDMLDEIDGTVAPGMTVVRADSGYRHHLYKVHSSAGVV